MDGILLKEYARMIWEGEKTLIVNPVKFKNVETSLYLIGDHKCYGTIKLKEPQKISLNEFREAEIFHKIEEDDRKELFGDTKEFYAYKFEITELYDYPREVEFKKDSKNIVKDIKVISELADHRTS